MARRTWIPRLPTWQHGRPTRTLQRRVGSREVVRWRWRIREENWPHWQLVHDTAPAPHRPCGVEEVFSRVANASSAKAHVLSTAGSTLQDRSRRCCRRHPFSPSPSPPQLPSEVVLHCRKFRLRSPHQRAECCRGAHATAESSQPPSPSRTRCLRFLTDPRSGYSP